MNRLMIGLVVGLALGSLITAWSASKYESSSSDEKSVVGYGAVSSTQGGATWVATNSTDVSGNSGWNITASAGGFGRGQVLTI